MKIFKVLKNWRVIILIIFLLLSLVAIYPKFNTDGVAIRSVIKNSSADIAGIQSPTPNTRPTQREIILFVNNIPVHSVDDYYRLTSNLSTNITITIKTNKNFYTLKTKPDYKTIILNETEERTIVDYIFNETLNKTVEITKKEVVKKTKKVYSGTQDLGIKVYPAPANNLKKGLDLEGGTRVLLQPVEKISDEDMATVIDNMKQRLNVYGLTDVVVKEVGDLSGNKYILVEIAGANEEEVKDLLAKQGKFEAKIGNKTIFRGGQDIKYVCRSANCAFAIDPNRGCGQSQNGEWYCTFSFSIAISPEAAQKQAEFTKDLKIITLNNEQYLDKKLELYLDDSLVDELNIGADLKGRAVTDIQISGSGSGATRELAAQDSAKNMKRLQTILITGSLPVKLDIVKSDTISPILGTEFLKNAIEISLIAILVVAVVVFIRYRKVMVSIPILLTMLFEIFIILGFAAFVGWNLDLAAIAGIIVGVGTGVDDQIVITEETLFGKKKNIYDWKTKVKMAFMIIFGAYFTNFVAMIPLLFAGAGLVKGFAFTSLVGITIGVLITRPAFAVFMEAIHNK